MRKAGAAVILGVVLATDLAHAQQKPAAPPGKETPGTFSLERNRIGAEAGSGARALFARGDCEHAIDAFDEALRHSADPTLHRDRGICHEKLGHSFPAIDDYRAYLTALPDAKDSPDIRERLARLEGTEPAGEGGEAKSAGGVGARCEARADCQSGLGCVKNRCSDGHEGDACETDGDCGTRLSCVADKCHAVVVDTNKKQSDVELDETKYSQAQYSPLRQGRGLILGFTTWPRAAIPFSGGNPQISETFAATLRYSFHSTSTIALDVGYQFTGLPGYLSSGDGPVVALGYEARIALDRYTTHALLLGVYVGYESPEIRGTRIRSHWFVPRGRIGYRLVIGPSLGLEFTADVGPAFVFVSGGSNQALLLGGSVGIVVGF